MRLALLFTILSSMVFGFPEPYDSLDKLYPYDDQGWFSSDNQMMLHEFIKKKDVKVVVELGSLLGLSTRYIAQVLPEDGIIYAVDHWLGNPEHQYPHRDDIYPKLPTLYERFLSNVIHANLCEKIVPMRMTTLEAAKQLADLKPDLVYVDATHEFDAVVADLEAWYPLVQGHGILCGDDWVRGNPPTVQQAVIHFANTHSLRYFNFGNFWWLEEF